MTSKNTLVMMQACGAIVFSTLTHAESAANNITNANTLNDWEAQTKDGSSVQLQKIQIEGRALSYYKEDESSLATGTSTPIDETPQSVQVITETLIEDQAARQITDLYRSISGMSQNNVSNVTLRGFSQNEVLYDGLKGDAMGGDFFAIPQLFTIEQVQVLKGPSGAIYGAGDPGGLINYVTKKPTYEQQNTLQVSAGNKDFLSGSIESSGPTNQTASQRYRVGIYADGQNSYRNNVEEENQIIDLGYAWDLNDDNTLTLQYTDTHQHISAARLRGIPTDDNGNFLADTSWNNNEKSDFQQLDAQVFQATLDHDINNWLSSRFSARYFDSKETQKYHEVNRLLDTNNDGISDATRRQYRDQVRTNEGISFAASLTAELDSHTILIGSDYYHLDKGFLYSRATGTGDGVSNLSFSNPVYGQDDVNQYSMSLNRDENTLSDRLGLYAQDQWQVTDRLNLLAGARLYRIEETLENHRSNTKDNYQDTGYSTRLGATYHINDSWKPYTSFSTGFVPQDAANQQASAGGPFDPEESQQFEAGVRSYWFNNKLNINLAAYHIVRENILQEDPNDSNLSIAIGKVRSQGLELDIMADITPRWVANLSYAYNDTIVKADVEGDGIQYANGDRFANTPYNQLGAWTRYDFPTITSSIAFGANYVSSQINRQGQTVKPYTVYDASWQTNWQDWKFQLNIKNLLDKKYAVSGFTENIGSFVGERRRIYVSAAYDF